MAGCRYVAVSGPDQRGRRRGGVVGQQEVGDLAVAERGHGRAQPVHPVAVRALSLPVVEALPGPAFGPALECPAGGRGHDLAVRGHLLVHDDRRLPKQLGQVVDQQHPGLHVAGHDNMARADVPGHLGDLGGQRLGVLVPGLLDAALVPLL